jgi:hypothetical protein
MKGKIKQTRKSRAFGTHYESEKQLLLFETPFEQALNPDNRWAVLARLIPWDEMCTPLLKIFGGNGGTGRPSVNPLVVIDSLIIKYLNDLDDRETVEQITENPYMQYFSGLSEFLERQAL